MARTERLCRSPVAETKASLEQWHLQLRHCKCSQRQHRCELQQFTPADAIELACVSSGIHKQVIETLGSRRDGIPESRKSYRQTPQVARACWLSSADCGLHRLTPSPGPPILL